MKYWNAIPQNVKRALFFLAVVAVASFSVAKAQDSATDSSHAAKQAKQNSTDIRNGLIESCETNGNPLREVVQSILQEKIEGSQDRTQIREFFPQIPEAQLDKLIHKQVEAAEKQRSEIEPIDCVEQYAPKDGK